VCGGVCVLGASVKRAGGSSRTYISVAVDMCVLTARASLFVIVPMLAIFLLFQTGICINRKLHANKGMYCFIPAVPPDVVELVVNK
jgi:hypothetical protein